MMAADTWARPEQIAASDIAAPLVLTCEHASEQLPEPWQWSASDLRLKGTHWAFDLGAAELTRELASATGAAAVLTRFSRLLIDANRPLEAPTLFRQNAEGKAVELNAQVEPADAERRRSYWRAYHDAVDRLVASSAATVVLAIHSFTPVYEGKRRDFEVGVLFDHAQAEAERMAESMAQAGFAVRLNEPYSGKQGFIYAAHHHATRHAKQALEIELRQDLAVDSAARARLVEATARWSAQLALALLLIVSCWALPAGAAGPSGSLPKSVEGLQIYGVVGSGKIQPLTKLRASLQRTPPKQPQEPAHGDPDALRYLLSAPSGSLPSSIRVASLDSEGKPLAQLQNVALEATPCPEQAPAGHACKITLPIRAVTDRIDAQHPLVRDRSVLAALGGSLVLQRHPDGVELGRLRVAGPRSTAVGDLERYRAQLRFVFVRLAAGGALPVGGDLAGATMLAKAALGRANALWGSCGVSFGPLEQIAVEVVDPPPPFLLAIGCDHGLPASGGRIQLRAGAVRISVPIDKGMLPSAAARRVAAVLRAADFSVVVSDNPRMAAAMYGSTDLLVRSKSGAFATLSRARGQPLSSDATLKACIGSVNLEDGLQHFGDVDASVGTLEERTLIKAHDDHDPRTIDVMLVPGFAHGGRIGESFIGADGGRIRNVVVVDRAGIRANRASFTLAHEIGHVLLDDPGHPDDYGIDTPSRLMDADASDPSAFGPRRLSLAECVRTVRQSGPTAPVPVLKRWPL